MKKIWSHAILYIFIEFNHLTDISFYEKGGDKIFY